MADAEFALYQVTVNHTVAWLAGRGCPGRLEKQDMPGLGVRGWGWGGSRTSAKVQCSGGIASNESENGLWSPSKRIRLGTSVERGRIRDFILMQECKCGSLKEDDPQREWHY